MLRGMVSQVLEFGKVNALLKYIQTSLISRYLFHFSTVYLIGGSWSKYNKEKNTLNHAAYHNLNYQSNTLAIYAS